MKRLLSIVTAFSIVASLIIMDFCSVSAAIKPEIEQKPEVVDGFLDRVKNDFDMVWNDEFNSDTLDTTKWQYDGQKVFRNTEAQMYADGPQDGNVYMQDGCVVLEGRKETVVNASGTKKNYTSGEISTQGKQNWKYGYFEVNAKLPHGNNTFPAIWLLGYDYNTGTCAWPNSGEIDVMEALGGEYTWSTLHHSDYKKTNHVATGAGRYENKTVYQDFHRYWMLWTDKYILIGVDDLALKVIDITTPAMSQSFRNYEHWLLFDFAMGPYGNKITEAETDDWRFFIDYVRVYQPKSEDVYDNYRILEVENTLNNGYVNSYYGYVKSENFFSVIDDVKAGTYDIYADVVGTGTKSSESVYNVKIDGTKVSEISNYTTDPVNKSRKSSHIATVKLSEDVPFEISFSKKSGGNMSFDKFYIVKTDDYATPDVTIDSSNMHEMNEVYSVHNESELQNAAHYIKKGGTIKLESDITLTGSITTLFDCTIDLNGHVLSTGTLKQAIVIKKLVNILVKNGTIKINGNSSKDFSYFFCSNEVYDNVFGLDNVTVDYDAKSGTVFGDFYGSETVTVKNSTFNFTRSGDVCVSNEAKTAFYNTTVNGGGFAYASKKNGTIESYGSTYNNCAAAFSTPSALASSSTNKFNIADSVFNNSKITNYDENIAKVTVETNNSVYTLSDVATTLTNSANIKISCNHVYDEATCEKAKTCKYCKGEIGVALGHNYGELITKDSDCVYTGKIYRICSKCSGEDVEKIIPIKDHDFEFTSEVVPSCAKEGVKNYTCKVCGIKQSRSYYGDGKPTRVAHTPDLTKRVVVEATCTTAGKTTDYCTVCKKTYNTNLQRGGHKYNVTVVSPTCVDDGYTKYECTLCSESFTNYATSKTGEHDFVNGVCKNCDYQESLADHVASGHTYGEQQITVAPKCEEFGKAVLKCTFVGCGYEKEVVLLPNGHKLENGICTVCKELERNINLLYSGGEWVSGQYDMNTGNYDNTYSTRACYSEKINVIPGEKYIISMSDNKSLTKYQFVLRGYDENGAFVKSIGSITNDEMTFDSNIKKVSFTIYSSDSSVNSTEILNKLSDATIKPSIKLEIPIPCGHESAVIEHNETMHWHYCPVCDLKFDEQEHCGGEATTTQKAICSVCSVEYGSTLPIVVVYGDVNDDGRIDAKDILLLRKYTSKWNVTLNMDNADCNADGRIDVKDVLLLRKYLAKWDVKLGK